MTLPGYDNIRVISYSEVSTICSAVHVGTGVTICMKSFNKTVMNESQLQYCRNELRFYKMMNHPYILSYIGHVETEKSVIILLENIQGVTLLEKINSTVGMIEFEAQRIFVQIVYAIYYLHTICNIVHRDLKLENIMLSEDMSTVKLIDFGVSSNSEKMSTKCGSFPYCAPEVIQKDTYTKSVDIWSAGVILFILLTGEFPFDDENTQNLVQKILTQDPQYPSHATEGALDLLKRMLDKDPDTRITIQEIIDHPWIKNNGFNNNKNSGGIMIEEMLRNERLVSFSDENKIDFEILEKCCRNHPNIRPESLKNDLLRGDDTEETVYYNIYKWTNKTEYWKMIKNSVFEGNLVSLNDHRLKPVAVSLNTFIDNKIGQLTVGRRKFLKPSSEDPNQGQISKLPKLSPCINNMKSINTVNQSQTRNFMSNLHRRYSSKFHSCNIPSGISSNQNVLYE